MRIRIPAEQHRNEDLRAAALRSVHQLGDQSLRHVSSFGFVAAVICSMANLRLGLIFYELF